MQTEIYEKIYLSEKGNWWYKSRRELITDTVSRIKQRSGKETLNILDVGCGTGLNSKALDQFGDVCGLDVSEDALNFSRSRGEFNLIRANADDLPFKHNSFDVVCALDVLEHIEDDINAMKEIHRVLKPSGNLILTVPAFMFLWGRHDEAANHKRRYYKRSIIKTLESCGFLIDRCTYWNFLLFPAVALIRPLMNRCYCTNDSYDLPELPYIFNEILLNILRLENAAIACGFNLPVGVSIFCVCRRLE